MPPVVSATEHPTTMNMGWSLHPCNTSQMLAEVLASSSSSSSCAGKGGENSSEIKRRDADDDHGDDGGWQLEWMRSWLMVVGNVVNLRAWA